MDLGYPASAVSGRAALWHLGNTTARWTTPRSPTTSRASRRCSSSPRRTRSWRAPIAVPPTAPRRGLPGSRFGAYGGERGELRGIGPGIEGRLRELVETGAIAELARARARCRPGPGRARALSRTGRAALGRARAGTRDPQRRRAQRRRRPRAGSSRRPVSGRRPRRDCSRRSHAAPVRDRAAGSCSTAPASSLPASRPRLAASPPAMRGAGAMCASCWRWSVPRRTRGSS